MKKLHIAFTSDTHGHILDEDYATGRPASLGLVRLAGPMRAWCEGLDSVIVDGGDTLQGTPLMKVWLAGKREGMNPAAFALNQLGCEFVTLGNHDFNFGRDVLAQFLDQLDAVCVCANVVDERGELPIVPWMVHVLPSGLRLGITGAVTDHVKVWERPEHLEGIEISDPVAAVRRAAEALRRACDIVACIYHGGFEEDLETGVRLASTTENMACTIARTCGLDLLLTGHQHMPIPGLDIAGTWCVQPPANAVSFVAVEAVEHCGTWSFASTLEPADGVPDEEIALPLAGLAAQTEDFLAQPAGCLTAPIAPEEKLDVALSGSAVAALINDAQLAATGADISCTALPNAPVGVPEQVTERDICVVYPFSNLLMCCEVTPEVVKASLERCASYLELGPDGMPHVSELFLRPKVEHYNFDIYAGIRAVADLRRPVGERIVVLALEDGSPLPEKLVLACNDYRASGTGGYDALGACPIVAASEKEEPDIISSYLKTHSPYAPRKARSLEFVW